MQTQDSTLPGSQQTRFNKSTDGGWRNHWRKGAPTAEMWQYYLVVNNVNKVGDRYGMWGSSVAMRFKKAGYELVGARGKQRKCGHCGEQFEAKNNHDAYCGDDCRSAAQNEAQKRKHRRKHPLSVKECANPKCRLPGRKFMQKHDARELYCSDDCKAAANRLRNAELFRKHARLRQAKVIRCDAAEQNLLAEVKKAEVLREQLAAQDALVAALNERRVGRTRTLEENRKKYGPEIAELRARGKSWGEIRIKMNDKHGEDYSQNGWRNFAPRPSPSPESSV